VAADPLGTARGQYVAARDVQADKPREADGPADKPRSNVTWLRRPATWLAAAAAAVVITTGVVLAVNQTAAPVTLASAQLKPLDRFTATGSAMVTEASNGSRTIEVQLNKDEAQGYQEVWLIAPDLSRLVSLGIMNSPSGRFEVPAGLDLSGYPIVDVSDEPLDGNPAHSSVSIVRGTLSS
jgi:anti-sigma-K factor RskA